jgi:hypothetical protein
MDLNIVEAAQAGEKFFLLGGGGEKNVVLNPAAGQKVLPASLSRSLESAEGRTCSHLGEREQRSISDAR